MNDRCKCREKCQVGIHRGDSSIKVTKTDAYEMFYNTGSSAETYKKYVRNANNLETWIASDHL